MFLLAMAIMKYFQVFWLAEVSCLNASLTEQQINSTDEPKIFLTEKKTLLNI